MKLASVTTTLNATLVGPSFGAHLTCPRNVGRFVGWSRKVSMPVAAPYPTDRSSLSWVTAQMPVWVKGLYWNMYDRLTNGVSGAWTSSYPTWVANRPSLTVVPSPMLGRNTW